jgi:hypothetical protein
MSHKVLSRRQFAQLPTCIIEFQLHFKSTHIIIENKNQYHYTYTAIENEYQYRYVGTRIAWDSFGMEFDLLLGTKIAKLLSA